MVNPSPAIMRIGYQGVPGAYSHQALECLLEHESFYRSGSSSSDYREDCRELELIGFESFESTHSALTDGIVDFILVRT